MAAAILLIAVSSLAWPRLAYGCSANVDTSFANHPVQVCAQVVCTDCSRWIRCICTSTAAGQINTSTFCSIAFSPDSITTAGRGGATAITARVLTHDQAEAIVTLDHDIAVRDLEQIIPYPMARDLVLKGPPDIAAYECACRHARTAPCTPTQVCMVIGQPFVDFILEHNPQQSGALPSRGPGVAPCGARPWALPLSVVQRCDAWSLYSVCNCCKCCCGGIEAMVMYWQPGAGLFGLCGAG